MKARFVLKWTGDDRAKARLVLQGFGDPDLLQGEPNTSSPTLSRSSRGNVCLRQQHAWRGSCSFSDVSTAFLPRRSSNVNTMGQGSKGCMPADWHSSRHTHPAAQANLCASRRTKTMFRGGKTQTHQDWLPASSAVSSSCIMGQDLISMIGLHVDDLLGGGDESHERYQEAKKQPKTGIHLQTLA